MSKIAGILLIIAGSFTILLGAKDMGRYAQLTPYAVWSSIALGVIMILAGLAHFRAPHKSFLLSIPILVTFLIHIYSVGLFYNVANIGLFLAGHAVAAVLILALSYLGYRRVQAVAV